VADAAQQTRDNAINRGAGHHHRRHRQPAFGESLKRAAEKKIVCGQSIRPSMTGQSRRWPRPTTGLPRAGTVHRGPHPTKGKVLILGGTLGHQTGDARRDGVKQVLEANGFEVIFRAADWDAAKALEIATNELQAHSDIIAVFGCWDPGALAGLSAVKQRGLLGKVKVFGFDGLPAAFKSIKDGELTATIKQDNKQMAQVIVKSVVAQIKGQAAVKKLLIDGFVIDSANVDTYL
jgi:hypothetical protein